MKKKFIASLLIVLSLITGGITPSYANDFIEGEYVNLDNSTRHIVPKELNLPTTPEAGLFTLGEPAYQENVGALVVVLAFSDTDESAYAGLGDKLDDLLNGETDSLKSIFADVSGNKVTYQAQIPQLDAEGNLTVVHDAHPRAYYERYMQYLNPDGHQYNERGMAETAESSERLYNLIGTALDNIPKENLDADILDGNGDGEVDNVITLFPDPRGNWADLLWPMSTNISQGELYPLLKDSAEDTTLGVGQITFQNYGVGLDTLYHETCHSLGLHDVYNYINQLIDLGRLWTPMSGGTPNGMNAIERESLGWLEPEVIEVTEEEKEYTLKALAKSGGNAYKINIDYEQSIYLEYRKKDDNLEKDIPGSGLLAWRCDETLKNVNGNAYGPPYYQYLYRPFGTEDTMEDTTNAFFSQNAGRTAMGVGTATPLFVPEYKAYEVTEDNPAQADEIIFVSSDGTYAVLRLENTYDTGISIYDIEEIEGTDEIKFKIKMGKPDTVLEDPKFSTMPGSYTKNVLLELSSSDGAEIRYTLDETDPKTSGYIYDAPINISGAVTVKAVCVKDGVYSNTVEAKYSCFSNEDTESLPSFDGSGKSQFKIKVPYDVVYIEFEDLADETVSGTLLVYDAETNSGIRTDAKKLFGKKLRVVTNGNLVIRAESENAKFKIKGYSGLNEDVSASNTSLKVVNDEKKVLISSMLKNNSRIPQDAKTIIALYDDDNMLVQAKTIDEALYDSPYSYLTGAYFVLQGNESKCNIFVWNDILSITPLTTDFASFSIAQ